MKKIVLSDQIIQRVAKETGQPVGVIEVWLDELNTTPERQVEFLKKLRLLLH